MSDVLYKTMIDKTLSNEQKEVALNDASEKVNYYYGKFDIKKKAALLEKCAPYWKGRREYESNLDTSSTPIYLDIRSRECVKNCVQALSNNQTIQSLLHPQGLLQNPISDNEQAILLDVVVEMPNIEPFILRLKAKVDNYTVDFESNTLCINDVKTIGRVVSEFSNNFNNFRYYRELAIYSWLMSLVAKKYYNLNNCIIKSNCLVVSTIPNYYTKVYEVTKQDFIKGWKEFRYLLRLVAHYYSKGYRFDGYN